MLGDWRGGFVELVGGGGGVFGVGGSANGMLEDGEGDKVRVIQTDPLCDAGDVGEGRAVLFT